MWNKQVWSLKCVYSLLRFFTFGPLRSHRQLWRHLQVSRAEPIIKLVKGPSMQTLRVFITPAWWMGVKTLREKHAVSNWSKHLHLSVWGWNLDGVFSRPSVWPLSFPPRFILFFPSFNSCYFFILGVRCDPRLLPASLGWKLNSTVLQFQRGFL